MSRTPGDYELQKSSKRIVEQIIRPTGLSDLSSASNPQAPGGRLWRKYANGSRKRAVLVTTPPSAWRGPDEYYADLEFGPLSSCRRGHARRSKSSGISDWEIRCPHRHQPAERGARPSGSFARRHPRCGQGGFSPLIEIADPDIRPRART